MIDDTPEADTQRTSENPGWRDLLAKSRAKLREALGDNQIDVDEIVHTIREERDIELLAAIRGEEQEREMGLGSSVKSGGHT